MLINSPNISGSLTVTGNAIISGSLNVAGGISAAITGSATTASYVEYSNVANKPTLVSGSSQVSFNGITDKPTLVSGSSQITYSGISSIPSGIVSSSTQITGYNIFATTGSNQFNGSQAITGSLTVTGQVVAQTLNVQQVTSSIVYSSGSNVFGNSLANTQQFTGSVSVTGSLAVAGAGTFASSVTAGGNVGIGGTNTESLLTINGTAGTSHQRFREGSTTIGFVGGANGLITGQNGKLVVRSESGLVFSSQGNSPDVLITSGNVLIGTTTDAGQRLQVNGNATISGNATIGNLSSGSDAIVNFATNASGGFRSIIYRAATAFIDFTNTAGTAVFQLSNGGAATFSSSVTATELYLSTSNGLVGNINSSNANGGYLTWQTSGTTIADIGTAQQIFGTGGNAVFGINGRGARDIAFGTNNTERMRITSAGDLSFKGRSTTTNYDAVFYNDNSQLAINANNTNVGKTINFNVRNDQNAMTITSGGNVGIGTSSPEAILHVNKASAGGEGGYIYIDNPAASTLNNSVGIRFGSSSGASYAGVYTGDISNIVTNAGDGASALTFGTFNGSSSGERMRITSGGNILINQTSAITGVSTSVEMSGVGTSTPTSQASYNVYSWHGTNATWRGYLQFTKSRGTTIGSYSVVANGDDLGTVRWSGADGSGAVIGAEISALVDGTPGVNDMPTRLVFSTTADGASSPTERMRITSGGYLKATSDGTYVASGSNFYEMTATANGTDLILLRHKGTDPYGLEISFSGATPNNGTNWFQYFQDASAARFIVRSNGGLQNYQANDGNLSDERTKKDIEPLESYWDKFKAIEIVKFKYKDQTHDDFNIGVIAQQVEAVAPEFVDVDGWGKPELDEEGNEIVSEEEPLKSIYTADLYHATIKVLQEAMAKIESLEAILQRNNLL